MLAFQRLSAEQIKQCFDYCYAWSDPEILYPAAYNSGDLNGIIDYLASLYYQESNDLPLPLVSFVTHLSETLGNLPGLTAWLDRLPGRLGNTAITPQHLADARRDKGPAASVQPPYLMVEIEPLRNSSRYHVYCYWQNTREEQWPLRVDDEEIGLNAVPPIVINELNKESGPPPYLELILPKALLTDNETLRSWEQWAIDSNERPRPLGVEYPISLRCRERLREVDRHKKCGYDHLVGYWKRYHTCFSQPPARLCAAWLTTDNKNYYIRYIHSHNPFFGLLFSPEPSYLYNLLDAGAAIVLWPRQANLSAPVQKLLDDYFSQHALHELPEALRQIREDLFITSNGAETGDLSLLWDDPNRKPELDTGRLKFPT